MEKKRLITMIGVATILIGFHTSLQARTFFRQTYNVSSSYSNAYTGNKCIGHISVEVRFSSDFDFCEIAINKETYSCSQSIRWRYGSIMTLDSTMLEVFLIATNPIFLIHFKIICPTPQKQILTYLKESMRLSNFIHLRPLSLITYQSKHTDHGGYKEADRSRRCNFYILIV